MDPPLLQVGSRCCRGGSATRLGDQVRFRPTAVFFWPEEKPLSALPPDAEIQGELVGFSDSGSEPRVFAIVEVMKRENVIVRLSDLEVIETESQA